MDKTNSSHKYYSWWQPLREYYLNSYRILSVIFALPNVLQSLNKKHVSTYIWKAAFDTYKKLS